MRRLFEGGVYSRAAFINLATRFVSNSDFLDVPIKRAYSTFFKTDYGDLSSARRCATLHLHSPDTQLGAAFISLEHGICVAFIRGRRLFEEIRYPIITSLYIHVRVCSRVLVCKFKEL